MCIIERLFASSLVAMVELANPRKLRVCHFKVSQHMNTHPLKCGLVSHTRVWLSPATGSHKGTDAIDSYVC